MRNSSKKTNLEILSEMSKNAINVVLSTIDTLKMTNEKIAAEYSNNDDRIKNIQNTQNQLTELKESNAKVISNFGALLK